MFCDDSKIANVVRVACNRRMECSELMTLEGAECVLKCERHILDLCIGPHVATRPRVNMLDLVSGRFASVL